MELIVIDPFLSSEPHFREVGYVTRYKSLIWDIQLYGLGDFDLVVPATDENISLLKIDRFICRDADKDAFGYYSNVMVIRNVNIEWDPDEGYMIHLTGKLLKDILNQRIIWNQITMHNVKIPILFYNVMVQNVTDPVTYVQGVLEELEDDLEEAQLALQVATNSYNQAVSQYGEDSDEAKAAKAVMDAVQARVDDLTQKVANETDNLSYQQGRALPYTSAGIVDYPEDIPTIDDIQLHGDQIGDWFSKLCEQYKLGWRANLSGNDFSFSFVFGEDKSDTVVFSPEYDNLINGVVRYSADNYHNGGQVGGEGEGTAKIKVRVGSKSGYKLYEMYINGQSVSQNSGAISRTEYKKMLKEYGKQEIQKHLQWRFIEGTIDPSGVFKYGVDFGLGDVVTISPMSGVSGQFRLVEVIESEDENGIKTIANFEEVED